MFLLRAFILLCFTFFLAQLHLTGDLTKYINMKYSYLSLTAAYLFGILTVVELIRFMREESKKEAHEQHDHHHDHEHCDCEHDHQHKSMTPLLYIFFLVPILTGFFFPVATLDSATVMAKGFHFPTTVEKDPYGVRQFLKPDTKIYFGEEGYREIMQKERKNFLKDNIVLDDKSYLKGMETIYNFQGDFVGKTLSYNGFVFNEQELGKGNIFIFRIGIIHCVADSGVFGMLTKFPGDVKLKNDEWVNVKGVIDETYYPPFKMKIPTLRVTEWKRIAQPKEPYVFRGYD